MIVNIGLRQVLPKLWFLRQTKGRIDLSPFLIRSFSNLQAIRYIKSQTSSYFSQIRKLTSVRCPWVKNIFPLINGYTLKQESLLKNVENIWQCKGLLVVPWEWHSIFPQTLREFYLHKPQFTLYRQIFENVQLLLHRCSHLCLEQMAQWNLDRPR